MMTTDHLPRELDISFRSLAEWENWRDRNIAYHEPSYRDNIVEEILRYGLREPITGAFAHPTEIVRGADLREGLNIRGIISRHRAVFHAIQKTVDTGNWPNLRIYAPEAVTAVALRLRGVFPKFVGSEFTLDPRRREEMYPIAFEDLTALTLPSGIFDLVVTNEVLEHVPDIDMALSEMARVLKPGGWHIGTHPLAHQEPSIRKSRLEGSVVVHLTEPEYHGDPFNDSGSLVFEIPGWDILERARRAGFSDAMLRLMVSQNYGYLSTDGIGIFVLCCCK